MEKLLATVRTSVPDFGSQTVAVPVLKDVDLSTVIATTADGQRHKITRNARKPEYIEIIFRGQKKQSIVTVQFFLEDGQAGQPEIEPVKTEVAVVEPAPEEPPAKKSKIPFLGKLQARQAERIALNQEEIDNIRNVNLSYPDLAGQKILTFDAVYSWARGLGMMQKAKQLQFQLRQPLHQYYDRVTGQGDGAIIAAAVASGIDFDVLANWWITDWRKVFNPGILKKVQRWGASKMKPYQSGYDAKQARAALRKLFTKSEVDLRMKDCLTSLQINVMQADMQVSIHYSPQNPGMELWTAVEDTAVTKMHFNQTDTVHGGAVFLGAIEKNDVMGLVLSRDNKNLLIHSIGAPVRVNPPAAKQLKKLGHAADKVALESGGHFVYEQRVEQLIEKLSEANYSINYQRFACKPIDAVTSIDTSKAAMEAGIDSGSGKINLAAGGDYEQAISV